MLTQLVHLLVLCKHNELGYAEVANEVLSLVEDRKMLPPAANFPRKLGGTCLCTMHENCSSCGGIVNEWEPE